MVYLIIIGLLILVASAGTAGDCRRHDDDPKLAIAKIGVGIGTTVTIISLFIWAFVEVMVTLGVSYIVIASMIKAVHRHMPH